jgi:hypothetical protein
MMCVAAIEYHSRPFRATGKCGSQQLGNDMKPSKTPRRRRSPVTPARRCLLTSLDVSPELLAVIAELAGWKLEARS